MAWCSVVSRSVSSPFRLPGGGTPHCLQLLTTTDTTTDILAPVPLGTWERENSFGSPPRGWGLPQRQEQTALRDAGPVLAPTSRGHQGAHLPAALPTLSTARLSNLGCCDRCKGQLCFDSHFSDYFLRILSSLWGSSLVDHVHAPAGCPATHMMPCLK